MEDQNGKSLNDLREENEGLNDEVLGVYRGMSKYRKKIKRLFYFVIIPVAVAVTGSAYFLGKKTPVEINFSDQYTAHQLREKFKKLDAGQQYKILQSMEEESLLNQATINKMKDSLVNIDPNLLQQIESKTN